MKVVLTGGGGLLGRSVAAVIASQGTIGGEAVDELVLADIRPVVPPADSRVKIGGHKRGKIIHDVVSFRFLIEQDHARDAAAPSEAEFHMAGLTGR